jgi:hypothetical protein
MSVDTARRVSPLHRGDPARLGRYRLTGRLGSGGMGVVYLGVDPQGGYVAIKLVHTMLAHDPEFLGRFRSEVERARQVPSFCTAEVLDADLDHQPPYLVVEYVDGLSLAEVVEQRGPLKAANLHSVAVGVATALSGIHGAGVVHRDLKPENVLLAPGSPKVIDFGIARAFDATSRHTRTGQMIGTVAYMAPERFGSAPGSPLTAAAADIFAWGCVVAYAGTGRAPFDGGSPAAIAARVLTQPPQLAGLTGPLRGVVELALAKDPKDRPNARELLDMLLGDRPVHRPAAVFDRPGLLAAAAPDDDHHPWRAAGGAPGQRVPAGAGRGARWLAFLAVLLVIAGLATVAAVLGLGDRVGDALVAGASRGGGSASGAPEAPPVVGADPTAPAAPGTAAPTTMPAGTAPTRAPTRQPAPVEPTDGEVIIQDPLSRPGRWRDSGSPEGNADCVLRGVLQARRADQGTFRCAGPDEEIEDDFGVEVTTALQTAGSCAGIWFHFSPGTGGHVLRICQDEMSLAADTPDGRVLGTLGLAEPIPLRTPTRVHLVVRAGRADVYRGGGYVGSIGLPEGGPGIGQVQLGISVETPDDPPPYTVTFADVDIRSL